MILKVSTEYAFRDAVDAENFLSDLVHIPMQVKVAIL